MDFKLSYVSSPPSPGPDDSEREGTVEDTLAARSSWARLHQSYDGRHRDAVRRSALVLREQLGELEEPVRELLVSLADRSRASR